MQTEYDLDIGINMVDYLIFTSLSDLVNLIFELLWLWMLFPHAAGPTIICIIYQLR